MRIVSDHEIADALDRVQKVQVYPKGEKIFLQLSGKFVDGDAGRILHMSSILAVANPLTGDLEEHEVIVAKTECVGDHMICLIEANPGVFRAPRIPVEANDNGYSKNVSYVELRFGSVRYPRASVFVVGITMMARPILATGQS